MKTSISLFLLPLMGFWAQVAWAEGSTISDGPTIYFGQTQGQAGGNHGVNRVIRTRSGYTAVQGTVTLSFLMPKNENAGNHSYEQVSAAGNVVGDGVLDTELEPLTAVTTGQAPQGNKPSVYLGGSFIPAVPGLTTAVDAGLQYEPLTINNVVPGWSIFINVANTRLTDNSGTVVSAFTTNPKVPAGAARYGRAWRDQGGNNNEIAGTIAFEARSSGSASFSWSSLGTIYANLPPTQLSLPDQDRWRFINGHTVAPWGNADQAPPVLFNTNAYAQANVKRVTALTRDAPYTSNLDGTMVTAQWSGCQVRPNGGALGNWQETDVDQNRTGYDAPREGDLAFDRRYKGKRTSFSVPIVSFAPIGEEPNVITNNTLRAQMGDGSRYTDETITINLATLARPIGEPLK